MINKICTKCKKEKPITEYFNDKQKYDGKRPDCKVCNTLQCTAWNRANKDRHRYYSIKHLYGVTQEIEQQMLYDQDNSCAICKINFSLLSKKFCIDHCHDSGNYRGLLCEKCNQGLGKFNDNIEYLKSAILYLEKYNAKIVSNF